MPVEPVSENSDFRNEKKDETVEKETRDVAKPKPESLNFSEEVVDEEFDEDDFDEEFDDDFEEEVEGEYELEDDQYGEEFNEEFGHLTKDEEPESKP